LVEFRNNQRIDEPEQSKLSREVFIDLVLE